MGPIFCVTRISARRWRAGPPTYVDMNQADLETQTADVISICGDRSRLISPSAVVSAITRPCHRSRDTLGLLRMQSSFYV